MQMWVHPCCHLKRPYHQHQNQQSCAGSSDMCSSGPGDLPPPLKVLDDILSLCTTTGAVVGHRVQHRAALSVLLLPLQVSSLYLQSFRLVAAIRHVCFAVTQGLLFPINFSAVVVPCQRVPITQGSCRTSLISHSHAGSMQPGCPQESSPPPAVCGEEKGAEMIRREKKYCMHKERLVRQEIVGSGWKLWGKRENKLLRIWANGQSYQRSLVPSHLKKLTSYSWSSSSSTS